MNKYLRSGLGILCAVTFLVLALWQISYQALAEAIVNTKFIFVLLSALMFAVGYACRIERWRLMLVHENPGLGFRRCAGPLMASFAANNVLPFRAGDLLRAFGFNAQLGVSAATSLTTLVVERLLDLLMVVLFLGLALAGFGMAASAFVGYSGGLLLLAGAALLALLLFPTLFRPVLSAFCQRLAPLAPRLAGRLQEQLDRIFATLAYTSSGATMPRLIIWSFLAWLAEGFVFWFAALALPAVSNPMAAWLAVSVGTLATVIPSTPGYVGTFDYFTAQAMAALGNTPAASAAFAFLVHAVLWVPSTLVGGLYLLANPASLARARGTA